MKKKIFLISFIFTLMFLFAAPVHAETKKIHSLSLSTLSITKNSQETFYWLMCNNKLDGYSNYKKDQHAYFSEKLTASQLNTLLDNAFGNSTDSDLNFFYFTGHTIFKSVNPISGPLGINLNLSERTYYTFFDLAKKLNSYKGKMIVLLDTCGSEAFITDGVKRLKDQSRISVICSSGYLKESEFGYVYTNPYLWFNGYRYNGFTYALGKGLGFFDSNNKMNADKNKNGSVSIQELFKYIDSYTFWYTQLQNNDTKMFSINPSLDIFSNFSVRISSSKLTLYKNKTANLSVKINGASLKPSWSSSNNSVVTVNSSGKVTAKKKGTATITCKVGGKSVKCIVTVKEPVVKISLNKKTASVTVLSSIALKATVSGTSSKVTWSSSNSKIAKVNSNGKVTGLRAGTVTIKATVKGVSCKCKVTVKNYEKDVSKVLNLSFNQARKKLGMNKKLLFLFQGNCKHYSLTGKKNSSFIANECLPEYEDIPRCFSLHIKDKYYSCSGAKIGMTKSEIYKKLTAGGWINVSGSTKNYYEKNAWSLLVSFKSGKASQIMIQRFG